MGGSWTWNIDDFIEWNIVSGAGDLDGGGKVYYLGPGNYGWGRNIYDVQATNVTNNFTDA